MDMTLDDFETEVSEQFDRLPDEVVGGLDNVVFVVEDRPAVGAMDLLGTYEGHDRFGRADYGYGQLPDVIVIFRDPMLAICDDVEQLRHQIQVTLIHEIGHYYGLSDAQLHDLGWAYFSHHSGSNPTSVRH